MVSKEQQLKIITEAQTKLTAMNYNNGAKFRAETLKWIKIMRDAEIDDKFINTIIKISTGITPERAQTYLDEEISLNEELSSIKDMYGALPAPRRLNLPEPKQLDESK